MFVLVDGKVRSWKFYHLGDTRSCSFIMKGSLVKCLKKLQKYFLLVTSCFTLALGEEVMGSNPALHHSQLKAMRTSFLGTIQRLGYLFCSVASQNKHLTWHVERSPFFTTQGWGVTTTQQQPSSRRHDSREKQHVFKNCENAKVGCHFISTNQDLFWVRCVKIRRKPIFSPKTVFVLVSEKINIRGKNENYTKSLVWVESQMIPNWTY